MSRLFVLFSIFICGLQSGAATYSRSQVVKLEQQALCYRLQEIALKNQLQISNCNMHFANNLQLINELLSKKPKSGFISVRKKMPFVPLHLLLCKPMDQICFEHVKNWFNLLEPACYPVQGQGSLANPDSNACFAGDYMIQAIFTHFSKSLAAFSNQFSKQMITTLTQAQKSSNIDLFDVFYQTSRSTNSYLMLAALAAIATSGNSGLTGWLQGLEDRLLTRSLNSEISADKVLEEFNLLQEAKYNYQKFRYNLELNQINISLLGEDISQWNRHNLMAAFLGCVTPKRNMKIDLSLISSIGKAYEGRDFVSHLHEGASLQTSIENFKKDSARYTKSAEIGFIWCNQN